LTRHGAHAGRENSSLTFEYLRVSTDKQGERGYGVDAQRTAVQSYLNGGDWRLVGEFVEVESGKRNDRPELEKALAACRKHKAKLVIAKLD
jgi:DNA invertase Pin-like site-specific DNA recombinase